MRDTEFKPFYIKYIFLDFQQEILESMKRAYETNMEIQNLLVEINGSRFAHNVSLSEVNFYVVKAMFTVASLKRIDEDIINSFNLLFKYFCPVLQNYIKGPNEMKDCLRALKVKLASFTIFTIIIYR